MARMQPDSGAIGEVRAIDLDANVAGVVRPPETVEGQHAVERSSECVAQFGAGGNAVRVASRTSGADGFTPLRAAVGNIHWM